jgi:hypothetical protein
MRRRGKRAVLDLDEISSKIAFEGGSEIIQRKRS